MRLHISSFEISQVFLNYPFDLDFEENSYALHFAVVAAGLIPVCTRDLSAPDKPRLETLVGAINNCSFSAHDLSRCKGEGENNYARLNMPIEMGMALFHALNTQRKLHRCAFFVSSKYDFQVAASDLAGLDPSVYGADDTSLVAQAYDWLRSINAALTVKSTAEVKKKYLIFKKQLLKLNGGGDGGAATHDEAQELMFQMCSQSKWWGWRANDGCLREFPIIPLSWKTKQ